MVEFISMVTAWSPFRKTYEATVLPSFTTRMHALSNAFAFMYVDQKLLKTIIPKTMFLSDAPLPVSGVKGFLLESYSITCCVSLASLFDSCISDLSALLASAVTLVKGNGNGQRKWTQHLIKPINRHQYIELSQTLS